jgi:hypothetical protein
MSRPIAGELPSNKAKLLKILGKHHTCPSQYHHPTFPFELGDFLPPKQQAPENSPGEFSFFKYQIQIITNSNS